MKQQADLYTNDKQRRGQYKTDIMVKLSLCLTKYHAMKTYCGSGGNKHS
jgi:hypothetical protein